MLLTPGPHTKGPCATETCTLGSLTLPGGASTWKALGQGLQRPAPSGEPPPARPPRAALERPLVGAAVGAGALPSPGAGVGGGADPAASAGPGSLDLPSGSSGTRPHSQESWDSSGPRGRHGGGGLRVGGEVGGDQRGGGH